MTHLKDFDAGQFYGFHGSKTSQFPPDENGVSKILYLESADICFFFWSRIIRLRSDKQLNKCL